MIEIFCGCAILCATAKQHGLAASIAVDKDRKKGARCSIFQLDLRKPEDRNLLEYWMESPLLPWVHFAPVCGTASRAREIQRSKTDPRPLRSDEFPHGLPTLSENEMRRVLIANDLFGYTCRLFQKAVHAGVLATVENPKNSYFWQTDWFLRVMRTCRIFVADFQVCMSGGSRNKWTRLVASFPQIQQLNIACDHSHQHEPWRFAKNSDGHQVWATSLESMCPRKMCVAVVQTVLQAAHHEQGLVLQPQSLKDIHLHPLMKAQSAQVSSGLQPRRRVPHLIPDFPATATFVASSLSDVPCSLLQKLPIQITLKSCERTPVQVPAASRFLRFSALSPADGGNGGSKVEGLKVAFGLPWTCETFIRQACKAGHPLLSGHQVPGDLQVALEKNLEWDDCTMSEYRAHWCKKWLRRALELKEMERADAERRPHHVKENTRQKQILVTEEILQELGYEDVQILQMLREGATLAGDIEPSPVFPKQYKPCMQTVDQLHKGARLRNEAILNMTKSSGDAELDKQLLAETREELVKGWARGPFELSALEEDAVISRRFPLQQSNKTRLIDDFSISGINETCTTHNKVDLHMIDTLAALTKQYFRHCAEKQLDSTLQAKTFDLKSAYRQIPIRESHLRYAYFCIYNCEQGHAEVYQMVTLPFGATHSVYCFLRFARMLHCIAARGLYLMNTSFFDDFILLSRPPAADSASLAMELVFMLTGWDFAREGKKKTDFSSSCQALGVVLDFSLSAERKLLIQNTEQRKAELQDLIHLALERGCLTRKESLVLRGKLGFADSFVHGRLGTLVLSKLIEHAYGVQKQIGEGLRIALHFMLERLHSGRPRTVNAQKLAQWFIYSDASYEQSTQTGGLGGVLINEAGECVAWFGLELDSDACKSLGALWKDTIIYELEMLAGVLSLILWNDRISDGLQVWFGDNDAVRYSLIKGSAEGPVAKALMHIHLEHEAANSSQAWLARVPTEANISDYPSRGVEHELLGSELSESLKAFCLLSDLVARVTVLVVHPSDGGEARNAPPKPRKRKGAF